MTDTVTLEALATEIRQQLKTINDGVDARTSDEQLRRLVTEVLDGLKDDSEFVRKLRFGNEPADLQLVGTKYARWGLSVPDVEFLHDLMSAHKGERLKNGGVHPGPSEELTRTFGAISAARYMSADQV